MEMEERSLPGAPAKQSADEDCSVCVAVHIRPLIAIEVADGCQTCLSVADGQKQVLPYVETFVESQDLQICDILDAKPG